MKKCLIMTMIIGGSLLGSAYTAEAAYTPSGCSNKPLCREFGYTKQSTNECATSDYLPCPFGEGYYCKTKNNGTGCVFGSILYDDLKCYTSSNVPSGRVPIGVVFDEVNTLALALDETILKWGWSNVLMVEGSNGDYGKVNTKKIIDAFIAAGKIDSDRDTTYAAGYCYNYTTPGVGRTNWFLPNAEVMEKLVDSQTAVNRVRRNFSSRGDFYGKWWAAETANDSEARSGYMFNYEPWRGPVSGLGRTYKGYTERVGCVLDYTDVVGPTPKTCEIGDVVYDDLKCYTMEIYNKTPIGVVVDPSQRLMFGLDAGYGGSLEGTLEWTGGSQNTLDLIYAVDVNEDLQQKACTEAEVRAGTCSTDAKAVTAMFASKDAVLEWLKPILEEKYNAVGGFKFDGFLNYGLKYCFNYSTAGTSKGDWFTPPADAVLKFYENYDLIYNIIRSLNLSFPADFNRLSTSTVCARASTRGSNYWFWDVGFLNDGDEIKFTCFSGDTTRFSVDTVCAAKY